MTIEALEVFGELPDPRWRKCKHKLEEILLAPLAVYHATRSRRLRNSAPEGPGECGLAQAVLGI